MEHTDVIAILNDLIATSEDGVVGYRTAAAAIGNPEAKNLLTERARRIEQSKVELSDLVRHLGGAPAEHGHVAAGLHRGWINLKAAISGKNDDTILVEVERGEQNAVKHYRDALNADLPPEVRMVVESQARGAEMNLTRIESLLEAR